MTFLSVKAIFFFNIYLEKNLKIKKKLCANNWYAFKKCNMINFIFVCLFLKNKFKDPFRAAFLKNTESLRWGVVGFRKTVPDLKQILTGYFNKFSTVL